MTRSLRNGNDILRYLERLRARARLIGKARRGTFAGSELCHHPP
jgi:hypothetical protein